MKILIIVGWVLATVAAAAIGMLCGAVMGIFVGPAQLFKWLKGSDESLSQESKDII